MHAHHSGTVMPVSEWSRLLLLSSGFTVLISSEAWFFTESGAAVQDPFFTKLEPHPARPDEMPRAAPSHEMA